MALGPRFGHGARQPGGSSRPRPGWRQHWLCRQVRGLRPDRNPLRRRLDRAETYLLAALFTAAAVSTPLVAELASHAARQAALQVRQEQLATRYLVIAHLSAPTEPATGGYALTGIVPAYATWTSVTGVQKSSMVPAPADRPKGTAVKIYTDGAGDPVIPPLNMTEIANEADAAGVGAVVGVVVVSVLGAAGLRQAVNRRRIADWTADWAVTAQTWNRQRW